MWRISRYRPRYRCVGYTLFRSLVWPFYDLYIRLQAKHNYYWGTATFVCTARSSASATPVAPLCGGSRAAAGRHRGAAAAKGGAHQGAADQANPISLAPAVYGASDLSEPLLSA